MRSIFIAMPLPCLWSSHASAVGKPVQMALPDAEAVSLLGRYWGDGGYVHISRDHHGCGIASDAIFAIVDRNDDAIVNSVTAEE